MTHQIPFDINNQRVHEPWEDSSHAVYAPREDSNQWVHQPWEDSNHAVHEPWEDSNQWVHQPWEDSNHAVYEPWEDSNHAVYEPWEDSNRAVHEPWEYSNHVDPRLVSTKNDESPAPSQEPTRQELSTVTNGLRRPLDASPTLGTTLWQFAREAYQTREDVFPENRVRLFTREMSGSDSSQGRARDIVVRGLNSIGGPCEPIGNKFKTITCAVKVGDNPPIGNPFSFRDSLTFSSDVREKDMPCFRLTFKRFPAINSSSASRQRARAFARDGSSVLADVPGQASSLGSAASAQYREPLFPNIIVRWYTHTDAGPRNMLHGLSYTRVMPSPGDLCGDAEIIKLCPEDQLMEYLIRMTWISNDPMIEKNVNFPELKRHLHPDIQANLDALELRENQPQEVVIWFLNPLGRDATNLEELVQSLPKRGFM